MIPIDAAQKRLQLRRTFGQYAEADSEEYLVPATQARPFVELLAELDIEWIDAVESFEVCEDGAYMWEETVDFARSFSLGEAVAYAERHRSSVLCFSFDVFEDIPIADRAAILAHKPGISVKGERRVQARDIAGEQVLLDMVWHHVQLHELSVEGGAVLDLRRVSRRYDQLLRVADLTRTTLIHQPAARFAAVGELMEYESPLPRSQWLLP